MARKKIVRLVPRRRDAADADPLIIETLVWALAQARRGKLNYFAAVFDSDDRERFRTIECGAALTDDGFLHMLGSVRMLEHALIERHRQQTAMNEGVPS